MLVNDRTEIHPFMQKPVPYRPIEFDIPKEETQSGSLTLIWYREPGLGGNGRGNGGSTATAERATVRPL